MRNANLSSDQRRAALRQLVIGRGPDAGRRVSHLKHRSLSPEAAEYLSMAEAAGLSVPDAGQVAGTGGVYFLSGWSTVNGSDVL